MFLRFLLVLIFVNPCYASGDAAEIINYLEASQIQNNTADAELLYQEAPGTDQASSLAGLDSRIAELAKRDVLTIKEVVDINSGLYPNGNQYNSFLRNHMQFCSPDTPELSAASSLGASCNANNSYAMRHADIKLSSLLDKTAFSATDSDAVTAATVIWNIIAPFPGTEATDIINDPDALVKSKNKKILAQIIAGQAALGVARHSFNEMFGNRLKEGNASVMQVMENQSLRRFQDPNWHQAVSQGSEASLLRELVHMQAYRNWVDYHQYRQNERLEALLATMVSQQASFQIQMSAQMSQFGG